MRYNKIQLKLLNVGVDQKKLSELSGYTYSMISSVLRRKAHNLGVQLLVAQLLKEDAHALWGNDFAPIWRKNNLYRPTGNVG